MIEFWEFEIGSLNYYEKLINLLDVQQFTKI